jgi:predicted nucleic acid-binding protein
VKRFVLDCSVAMAWAFEDEADAYADAVLSALVSREALVPSLWPLEVVNVLLGAERSGRLTAAGSARFLDYLGQLPILIDTSYPGSNTQGLLDLGRGHGLTAYDAAYLGLSMREGVPLASRDKALRSACKRSGVLLFSPGR